MTHRNDKVDRDDDDLEAKNFERRINEEYSKALWSGLIWFDPPQVASECASK